MVTKGDIISKYYAKHYFNKHTIYVFFVVSLPKVKCQIKQIKLDIEKIPTNNKNRYYIYATKKFDMY